MYLADIVKIFSITHKNTTYYLLSPHKNDLEDFPGGTVVKNPPANAGDTGSRPGQGRSHMPRSN